jgi:hypothetical protein
MTRQELRQVVAERAGHCCEYCLSQEEFSHDDFSVEHITPRARGGSNDLDNLAFSCQGCNNRKFIATEATDPVTGEPAPLFHPRQHAREEHFLWVDDSTLVVGLTPTGRATVEKLQLNRPRLVNLRRALRVAGKHPPSQPGES